MKALLLYPQFPHPSYGRFMEIAGLRAVIPPLGITTVAALLASTWDIRFDDRSEEAIRIANGTNFGLAAGVHT